MKCFKLLAHDIGDEEFFRIKKEISEHEALWLEDNSRQAIPAHQATQTIYFRKFIEKPGVIWQDIDESEDTINMQRLPKTAEAIRRFAKLLDGQLARVICAKLNPLGVVPPHIDEGPYYVNRDRFHYVINSTFSLCGSGHDVVKMRENQLWWLDNKSTHYSTNLAFTPRIHLIFDLSYSSGKSRFKAEAPV